MQQFTIYSILEGIWYLLSIIEISGMLRLDSG